MDNFEEHLMGKFPDLFPRDKEGNVTYSSCGIGGLEEWEPIIEEACAAIVSRCKTSYRFQKTKKLWPRVKYFVYQRARILLYNRVYRLLDPYRGIVPQELKKGKMPYTIKPEWTTSAKLRKRYVWQNKWVALWGSLCPTDTFEKIYPPMPTLAQLKTKFNQCRFYIDGGDEIAYAIIDFTERLCDQITKGKLKIEKL